VAESSSQAALTKLGVKVERATCMAWGGAKKKKTRIFPSSKVDLKLYGKKSCSEQDNSRQSALRMFTDSAKFAADLIAAWQKPTRV
jgi:hypothetical protein